MPRKLMTDFVKIATAGDTVDGRMISEAQIKEMGDNYDREDYTAVISYEHIKYFGNMGLVQEAKAEKDGKGRLSLYAKLTPSDDLVYLNRNGQKLFTSIEMNPDFTGTGKAYLIGLAVTDSPAAIGTDELHFSQRKQDNKNIFSNPMDLQPLSIEKNNSLLGRWFNSGNDNPREEDMSQKQLNELTTTVAGLATQFENFSKHFSQPEEQHTPPAPEPKLKEEETAAPDNVSQLSTNVESLLEKFNALETENNALREDFTALKDSLDEEVPGTQAGEDTGPESEEIL